MAQDILVRISDKQEIEDIKNYAKEHSLPLATALRSLALSQLKAYKKMLAEQCK